MAQTVSSAMQCKAEKLAALVPFMSTGRSKVNGITFYIVPSKAGTAWWSNGLGCTCPGFDQRGTCTHQIAVSIHQTRESERRIAAAQAAIPKPRKTYAQLMPGCPVVGCDDDALRSGYCLGHRSLATVAS